MKDERKPVSFIEDCAVPLVHLAEYTDRLNQVFEKYGTKGTFYAHASVGCLHVRPVLNLKLDKDLKAMRAIAEEAFALVQAIQGLAFGRAWRRHRALGIPRTDVRRAAGARLRRGEGAVRSRHGVQPGQDRRRAEIRRQGLSAVRSELRHLDDEAGARLVGISRRRVRFPGRGRDVQQQRRLPEARRRRDVSVLPRDA